ncbi:DUF6998 domain-containing protein [Alicyclobacillus dauci]|uniref:DUF6998 domain-containing protein n=1 Tax=Alicyclobacillus dauci TaxID=1475485 RepID=A0ABY6Z8I0_9BACL|nr:hypothetical protein [Alicyclobacillus dauci]WAH39192.1 hypothetical protein NZD86_11405 [Alicyclobacillus dauci]
MIVNFIRQLSDNELIDSYGVIIDELKRRQIIRSKNVVGDLGEYIAIKHYCETKGLPRLQAAPPSTKNIDAISVDGDRYSIKATTSGTTSVFYGLNPPASSEPDQQKFEYVILVIFDTNVRLKQINELTWKQFLQYKRWHSRMGAWNLTVSKELLENTRVIYRVETL